MKIRPRFTLMTLLTVMAICAVLCAAIWQFWPRLRDYQARMRFEEATTHLHPGMSVDDVSKIVGRGAWNSYSGDAKGRSVALTPYFFDGAWYCIYMELDPTTKIQTCSEQPCTTVKSFRLAVPPINYAPQTQAAKDDVNPTEKIRTFRNIPNGPISVRAPPLKGEDARRTAYIEDFYQLISSRTEAELGITYEQLPQK